MSKTQVAVPENKEYAVALGNGVKVETYGETAQSELDV